MIRACACPTSDSALRPAKVLTVASRLAEVAFVLLPVFLDAAASPPRREARRLAEAAARQAEHRREEAEATHALAAVQAQADRLADQRAQQAAALRVVEAQVVEMTGRAEEAVAARKRAEAALAAREAALEAFTPLMLRLARLPTETVLAVAAPPTQAVEGLLIVRGLAIQFDREAAALRRDQEKAARASEAASREAATLAVERDMQARQANTLDRSLAQAGAQVSQAEAARAAAFRAVAATAARAPTLPDAMSAVERAQTQATFARPAGPALPLAARRLVTPVAGRVQRRFGAPAEDGPAAGTVFATAPGAFVSSPCAGRVAFAAPFRSYGQLLIVECGGGIDVVLAGLGRLDATPGHAVRSGEPLGRMPDSPARPSLYLELRQSGQPVDPVPFLSGKL